MLPREYAIKGWFIIPLLVTNVSALPGETWTRTPKILSFQSRCIPCLKNDTALACYIFDTHQPILIIFVDNNAVLLSTVCKYYFSPSHFVFETRYTAWLKRQFLGFMFSQVVQDRWDYKSLFDSILFSNISAKNYQIGWSASKFLVSFLRHRV